MVLTEREFAQAEAIFLLIDNGVVSYEQTHTFMSSMYNLNYEILVFMDWLLTRWVLLRKHKFHLPTQTNKAVYCTNCGGSVLSSHNYCGNCGTKIYNKNICLTNLINSNST